MKNVLSLVMLAGLLAFLPLWILLSAGLPVERPLLMSLGIALTATGLLFVGEALMPWERAWWKPAPGARASVRLGRVSSLGFGFWFSAGGVAFLGTDWLPKHILLGILGAFAAAGFALIMLGMSYDRRDADVATAAIRRRGWIMASRREDDALPADDAQRRQDAREEQRWFIQRHLTGRTTLEHVETQHRYLVGSADDTGSPTDWPEVAEEWRAFRSAFADGDQIWEFNTVSTRAGLARGEQGFARLRDGRVADWFVTAVVG